jgi:purine-binding chemotaxis protein CheW
MRTKNQREKNTFTFAHAESNVIVQTGELQCNPEDQTVLTPEQKQRILNERARVLARGQTRDGVQEETIRIVEFFLAHECYAVEATFVREVQHVKHLTPLPCTPSFVLGIMNIRGHILSVVDLRVFFDLPQDRLHERDTVIVLRTEEFELGVLTDGVIGARPVSLRSIMPVSPGLSGIRREYLRGISEEHTILLDVERILSDKRMLVGADEVEL